MLSLVASTLAFNVNSGLSASAVNRAPAVTMVGTGALESTFVYESRTGLAQSLGLYALDTAHMTGAVVPTGAVKKASVKAVKSFESKFSMAPIVTDSSVGPPCGICHHQGSGSWCGKQAAVSEAALLMGNCANDECQIG